MGIKLPVCLQPLLRQILDNDLGRRLKFKNEWSEPTGKRQVQIYTVQTKKPNCIFKFFDSVLVMTVLIESVLERMSQRLLGTGRTKLWDWSEKTKTGNHSEVI